ncbi:unnamed protein product [Arctia plantaginis]|uniref:LIM zinc-binding domain-containing protein n=1 Tax=Arctia plantaginis TaxID=874455 RepID=A0A8S1BD08_ARCPL|nr:unnamed protein product [Arctia plantaginis]
MACAVCEHCLSPLMPQEKTAIRQGFSYHKKCLKCYVCSETNLHNAEVFKGVIFCFSCAQRIFQGCASARKTRQQVNSRLKRPNSRSRSYAKQLIKELQSTKKPTQRDPTKRSRSKLRRKRERSRFQEKHRDRLFNSVIERAQMGTQSTSDSDHSKETNKTVVQSKPAVIAELLHVEKDVSYDVPSQKRIKQPSVEIGVTTDVTQLLLKQINDYMQPMVNSSKPSTKINMIPIDPHVSPPISPPISKPQRPIPKKRKPHRRRPTSPKPPKPEQKPVYSDLRIAELGVSTEIANMALRKKSEVPVIIKSDKRPLDTRSLSILDQESDESGHEWMDSAYSTLNESDKPNCLDRRLRSILKIPYKFFKRNILTRSSQISVLMSSKRGGKVTLAQKIKMMFYEEITEHRGRGMQRLYSTINRRKIPYKLGWVEFAASVSGSKNGRVLDGTVTQKRCRHLNSHSYKCMRSQALRLAGPTSSELARIRKKIKSIAVPKVMKTIANFS